MRRLILFFILGSVCFSAFAQQTSITGKVINPEGNPVPGASVMLKGTTIGTFSNDEGVFFISGKIGDALLITSINYAPAEVTITSNNFTVRLAPGGQSLSEVIVVAYGTQRRGNITGAISSITDKEILKAPPVGITSVLGARVAGVSMLQQSGQPGSDAASLLVRGESATYIVDGVVRSINEIDPNEIESISVLKDASSASIYGLNATSVVIVTTKKGAGQKLNITYNGTYGTSQNADQLKWLDGPGYAYYYNLARTLDGDPTVFNEEVVQKMKDGVDGWGNTDWYGKTFGVGDNQSHNVTASGGNEKVRFFTSIGAFSQNGNVDQFNFDRYNLRANIDANISKSFKMTMGFSGRVENRNAPGYSANPDDWHNIPQQAVRALPYVPEKITIDGVEYYTATNTASSPVSPIASIYNSGYVRSNNNYIQSNFTLEYFAPWLKGLSLKFMGAYDKSFQFTKLLDIPFVTMLAALPSASTTALSYSAFADNSGNTSLTESASNSTNVVTQSSVNFDRAFGKHKITFLGLAETRNAFSNNLGATGYGLDFLALDELNKITNLSGNGSQVIPVLSGTSGQSRLVGLVGRINYNFSEKYLAEISLRRDGSYLFSGMNGSRWVSLPSGSLGWRIDKEKWFHSDKISTLKLRGGVGKTATSAVSPFQYMNLMTLSSNAVVIGGSSQSMIFSSTLGNPSLTWAKALSYNGGFDLVAWNGLLGLEFDAFYKYQYALLAGVSGSYPPSMGGYFFTTANVNKIGYRGVDFTLSHNNRIGDFRYGAKLVGTYTKRTWLYYAGDSPNTPDYQKLTGKEVGSQFGFVALGLFQSQDEIDNSPTIDGSKVLPGYIRYKDLNGDGKISYAQDMAYVGKSAYPKFQSSLNLYGDWKGFDFDILFLSGLGRDVALTGVYTATGSEGVMDNTVFTTLFNHRGNSPVFLAENSWTPDHTNAEFPRLSLVTVSSNNAYSSTFWYRSGDYLRLKSFQLGFTFPKKIMQTAGIEKFRIFIQGSNLFTLSGLSKYNIDPEEPGVNNGYYPQQKTFSCGVNLTL
jgi:TonB-linked SusC/RagA family outer membrane protein